MAKPVIWTVDDDPDVLRAVERDLRSTRVLTFGDGAEIGCRASLSLSGCCL